MRLTWVYKKKKKEKIQKTSHSINEIPMQFANDSMRNKWLQKHIKIIIEQKKNPQNQQVRSRKDSNKYSGQEQFLTHYIFEFPWTSVVLLEKISKPKFKKQ